MSDDTGADAAAQLEQFRQQLEGSDHAFALIAKLNDGIAEASGLDVRTLHLVRCAAMAAAGAPAASWEAQLALAGAVATDAEILGTLIAIAPIIGTARYAAAISNIAD